MCRKYQAERVVAVAAGSVGGGLIALLLLVAIYMIAITVYLALKWKINYSQLKMEILSWYTHSQLLLKYH